MVHLSRSSSCQPTPGLLRSNSTLSLNPNQRQRIRCLPVLLKPQRAITRRRLIVNNNTMEVFES